MIPKNNPREEGTINVKDEKEFKLWVKFIASIHKDGGDIRKPIDILWKSIEKEICDPMKKGKRDKKSLAFS